MFRLMRGGNSDVQERQLDVQERMLDALESRDPEELYTLAGA
jgi:hypothetical protein